MILDDFWDQFCYRFSYFCWIDGSVNSSHRLVRESCFASHDLSFFYQIQLFVYAFSKLLLGTVFRGSQCLTLTKSWFWIPFRIFWVFKKTPVEDHFGPHKLQRSSTPVEGERPFRDPVFHKTIDRGFFKYICSMEIGSLTVFVAFRCAMFYTTLLSLVFIIPQ